MRVYVRDKGRTLSDFADERNLHLMLEFHDNRWLASLVPGPQYRPTHGPTCALTKDGAIAALCESIGVLKDKEYEGC